MMLRLYKYIIIIYIYTYFHILLYTYYYYIIVLVFLYTSIYHSQHRVHSTKLNIDPLLLQFVYTYIYICTRIYVYL